MNTRRTHIFVSVWLLLTFSSFHYATATIITSQSPTTSRLCATILSCTLPVATIAYILHYEAPRSTGPYEHDGFRWQRGTFIHVVGLTATNYLISFSQDSLAASAALLSTHTITIALMTLFVRTCRSGFEQSTWKAQLYSLFQAALIIIAQVSAKYTYQPAANELMQIIASATLMPAFSAHMGILWIQESGYSIRPTKRSLFCPELLLKVFVSIEALVGIFATVSPLADNPVQSAATCVLFTVICAFTLKWSLGHKQRNGEKTTRIELAGYDV